MIKKTLYDVLHVSRKATQEIIDAAYGVLHEKFKDAVDPDSQNEMKLVQQAYKVLSDPNQKAMYDLSIKPGAARPNIQLYPDGMVEEVPTGNNGVLKWVVLAALVIGGVALYLNHTMNTKKLELDALNVSRHLDNEETLVNGEVDNVRASVDNAAAVSNRALDIAQEQEVSRRIAIENRVEEQRRQQEFQQRMAQERQDSMRKQQEANQANQAARQEEQAQNKERQRLMYNMISLKEWDSARGLAKTPQEISYIDQMERSDQRNRVSVLQGNGRLDSSSNSQSRTYMIMGR